MICITMLLETVEGFLSKREIKFQIFQLEIIWSISVLLQFLTVQTHLWISIFVSVKWWSGQCENCISRTVY